MRLVQGSETVQEIKSRSIGGGGGRHVAKAPRRIPGSPTHAIPEGSTTGLCGVECRFVFEQEWRPGSFGRDQWCPACVKLAPTGG